MTYKPVICEVNLFRRTIIPAAKGVCTNKLIFLIWALLYISYLLLVIYIGRWVAYLYLVALYGGIILMLHKKCIKEGKRE